MSEMEPIAVVGTGCRFPGGVADLSSLGETLLRGDDAVREVPPDRWPSRLRHDGDGSQHAHMGAFLDDITRFDAAYFGISPREAQTLDPQHRLLLEVAWEAMSDAGVPRHAWRGSGTGVYVGMLASDYAVLHAKTRGIEGIGPHYASGVEFSFAAGRLAYTFDLHGPVCTISSACSSSLLAVHQAAQSLRGRECDVALAGGVSLLVSPELSIFMSRIGAISPTGHCRPFDAAADGIVRGEGCGIVVLKRLSDALAAGDRVLATIAGSAVNHDGFSMGLTVPNASAQTTLLREALVRSGVPPETVDYVEAHGTGTPLGDQIELNTLAEVYGEARHADQPLLVGSHKAIFGHTDSAAGILGLLKAIWVVNARQVPPQSNLETLTPTVEWDRVHIAVPDRPASVPEHRRPARAAVSAFGLSGSNAHVLIEGPTGTTLEGQVGAPSEGSAVAPTPPGRPAERGPHVLLVSAAHASLLPEQMRRMRDLIAAAEPADVGEIVASAATRRTHEEHRLAVIAHDRDGLHEGLDDAEEATPGRYRGHADPDEPLEVVFVYSGQGCQWPGMAVELADRSPVVRDVIEECDQLIREHANWSLWEELRRAGDSRLGSTDIAQPAIFAVQVALTRWLTGCGITPAAVIGHSVGEVTAAHVAGCLTLPDAVRLIVHRGTILQQTAGRGRMAALQASPDMVRDLLADTGSPAVVATVNGPSSVVVAGSAEAVEGALRAGEGRGLHGTPLPINYAFHSPLVADQGPALARAVAGINATTPEIRLLSSVNPDADMRTAPDPMYWQRNLTDPVLLWPAVDRLLAAGNYALAEISPQPVLRRPLQDALTRRNRRGPVIVTLQRNEPGPAALYRAAAEVHVAGGDVCWDRITGRPRRYRTLARPSWGGDSYWLPGVAPGEQGGAMSRGVAAAKVSLLDDQGHVLTELDAVPLDRRGTTPSPTPETTTAPGNTMPNGAPPRTPSPETETQVGPARSRQTADVIAAIVRDILGLAPDAPLSHRRGLFELGLDSLTALQLRHRLAADFAVDLPRTVVFEHPTVSALASYLKQSGATTVQHDGPALDGAPAHDAVSAQPTQATDGVAVVGLACRLPGAESPAEFWTMIREARDAIGDLPAARRADPVWAEVGPDVPVAGGYLNDVAGFDAGFFRTAPREARSIDPQQRIFLEVAWEALEDAGLAARGLQDRAVGVYVGLNTSDYQQLLTRSLGNVDLYYGTGTSFAATAGRLSYFLGTRGPCMAVDTACSASLTAVHLACQALANGDCEAAIVGGANVIVSPTVAASMSAGGALAPDGRCKTFDQDADGYGRGEGTAALVLKPLVKAREAGDRIYAVIRGTAVNTDGASGGLTVPSGAAQTEVIRRALGRAGWAAHEVDYVEAHGTGTPLGDPIEVRALAEALGPGREHPVLLGSVKANIGHLEAAAGVSGMLKVILALYHGAIPPHILTTPSERIEWDRLPVAVPRETQPWPDRGRPARAGISAFGFTGSNAHVLMEQAAVPKPAVPKPEKPPKPSALPYVLPITAAGPEALAEAARRMAERLRGADPELTAEIVHTATYRRSRLEHRLVVIGADAEQLAEALTEQPPDRTRTGKAAVGEERRVVFRYRSGPAAPGLRELPAYADARRDCLAEAEANGINPEQVDALSHQAAMTRVWAACGVTPDAVTGTDEAGPAAAWAAGRLSLADALRATPAPIGEEDIVVDVAAPRSTEELALTAAELIASGLACGPAPAASARPPVDLPPYPWQRRRYWYREQSASVPLSDGSVSPGDREPPPDDRLFEITWQKIDAPGSPATPDTWAVASGRNGTTLADDLAAALEANGHTVVRLRPESASTWGRALEGLAEHPSCRGVLLVSDSDDVTAAAQDAQDALAIGQRMAALPRAPGKLWFVTSGAHDPTGQGEVRPSQAARWELGRVLAVELPARWGGLLDVTGDLGTVDAALHAQGADGDDQICLHHGQWYAARLMPASEPAPSRQLDPERWHLALGDERGAAIATRALARNGARRILAVTGNAPASAAGGNAPASAVTGSPDATVETCPPEDLATRLAELPSLGDVVAAVAPARTCTLAEVTGEEMAAHLAAAQRLTAACAIACEHAPQRVTLLTSAASAWGSVNTALAAPAAGWLTAWTAQTTGTQKSLLALMPREDTDELAPGHLPLFEESGLRLLTPQDAEDLTYHSLQDEPTLRYAASVDLNHYVRLCQELAPRHFLDELSGPERPVEPASILTDLPPEARQERLTDEVLDAVSGALGLDGTDLDTDAGFFELGMDSVMALTVRRHLEGALGLELPSTLAFEYPTATKLAEYLGTLLNEPASQEPTSQEDENHETDDLLQALDHAMASAERDLGRRDLGQEGK